MTKCQQEYPKYSTIYSAHLIKLANYLEYFFKKSPHHMSIVNDDDGGGGGETPYFLCAIVQLLSQKALG